MLVILQAAKVQQADADDGAAEHAEQIGVEVEQWHHHGQRDHPRQHQEFHGRDAERPQRIDLLVDLHRPELCGERGPGATGHDDRGHHRAHLTRHGDADEVRDIGLGPERAQLHGADVREDHPHEEGDQGDDRERLGSDLLRHEQQLGPLKPRLAGEQPAHADARFADEGQHVDCRPRRGDRARSDAAEHGRPAAAGPHLLVLRRRAGQRQKALCALRQTDEIHGHLPAFRFGEHGTQEDQHAAVPPEAPITVDGEPRVGRRHRLCEHIRRGGWSRVKRPASRQS